MSLKGRDPKEIDRLLPDGPSFQGIRKHLGSGFFSEPERATVGELLAQDQAHLFADWDPPGTKDSKKRSFLEQIRRFNESYAGGISSYIEKGRTLLADATEGKNPWNEYTVEVPKTVDLTSFDQIYQEYEHEGLSALGEIGVVLVAGGLGERLGYPGIKIEIPVETITGATYLQHYARTIQAMENRAPQKRAIPLVIMTSEQTDRLTRKFLKHEKQFGLKHDQIEIVQQTLVPSFSDPKAHLALKECYELWLKPNGHGNVHHVLHTQGIAEKLFEKGVRRLLFVQDTNGQVFNAMIAALGASRKHDFDFTSIAVPRVAKEAMGALAQLRKDSTSLTVNVEYNQLDALLRATTHPDGDVEDATGWSPYPGNVNGLIVNLSTYRTVLQKSGGLMPEFINPKYADEEKSKLKEPARLETMMQDLPRLFSSVQGVGVVTFDRKWCFSPLKNRLDTGAHKQAQGQPPECALTAEVDFYAGGGTKCAWAGSKVDRGGEQEIWGLPFSDQPRVILSPSFALTLDELRKKLRDLELQPQSTLIINGKDIELHNVSLAEGAALEISVVEGASVVIDGLHVKNEGYQLKALTQKELEDDTTPPYLKIRGYCFQKVGCLTIEVKQPGRYRVGSDGILKPSSEPN